MWSHFGVFWDAFLPNFIATIFGVILGLPVALYVNNRLSLKQSRLDAELELRRLGAVTNVLLVSVKYNRELLVRVRDLSLSGSVMRNPDLQLTTWEAVGQSFSSLCEDPELVQIVSHHWLRLNRIYGLNSELFSKTTSSLSLDVDVKTYSGMWGELHAVSCDLIRFSDDISERLYKYSGSS